MHVYTTNTNVDFDYLKCDMLQKRLMSFAFEYAANNRERHLLGLQSVTVRVLPKCDCACVLPKCDCACVLPKCDCACAARMEVESLYFRICFWNECVDFSCSRSYSCLHRPRVRYVYLHAFTHVRMFVCLYPCMQACMFVCVCI